MREINTIWPPYFGAILTLILVPHMIWGWMHELLGLMHMAKLWILVVQIYNKVPINCYGSILYQYVPDLQWICVVLYRVCARSFVMYMTPWSQSVTKPITSTYSCVININNYCDIGSYILIYFSTLTLVLLHMRFNLHWEAYILSRTGKYSYILSSYAIYWE